VTSRLKIAQTGEEYLIAEFFQLSSGQWRSQRRYYTLPDGETQEMVTLITIRFLEQGCAELQHLAKLHLNSSIPNRDLDTPQQFADTSNDTPLTCGAFVSWESTDSVSAQKQSKGSTLFGVRGTTLYRDRGFATSKPVTAEYYFTNPKTLCLRTEYKGSVFEEELKLIGSNYRTRQTIISRAGEQQMIGQYLEKRIE
jgi:hypothetical protein